MHNPEGDFDFAAYKDAFENQHIESWLAFYADYAEWIEYRHSNPPSNPNRMMGRNQIADFLRQVKGVGLKLKLTDEVLGPSRAAFCVTCTLPNCKRIIENVIVHHEGGKIIRQVDVEAWD